MKMQLRITLPICLYASALYLVTQVHPAGSIIDIWLHVCCPCLRIWKYHFLVGWTAESAQMICTLLERANICPKLTWIWMFTNAFGYLVKTLHWQVIYNSILDAIPATQQLASWIVMLSSCYSLLLLRYQVDATFHQKRYTCGKYCTFSAQETVCESPPFAVDLPFSFVIFGSMPSEISAPLGLL